MLVDGLGFHRDRVSRTRRTQMGGDAHDVEVVDYH
jgi:hypothetical protein